MKIPYSLKFIRSLFLQGLDLINEKIKEINARNHSPRSTFNGLQLAKSSSKKRPITKKKEIGRPSKAKGPRHSETTIYNHPRKDYHSS